MVPFILHSGNGISMTPFYREGRPVLVLRKPFLIRPVMIGDVILAGRSWAYTPLEHRVVGIGYEDGEQVYITQGDNNGIADEGARREQDIIGRVVGSQLTRWGWMVNYLVALATESGSQGVN